MNVSSLLLKPSDFRVPSVGVVKGVEGVGGISLGQDGQQGHSSPLLFSLCLSGH